MPAMPAGLGVPPPRRRMSCRACTVHGSTVSRANKHWLTCPFRECSCSKCIQVRRVRETVRRNYRKARDLERLEQQGSADNKKVAAAAAAASAFIAVPVLTLPDDSAVSDGPNICTEFIITTPAERPQVTKKFKKRPRLKESLLESRKRMQLKRLEWLRALEQQPDRTATAMTFVPVGSAAATAATVTSGNNAANAASAVVSAPIPDFSAISASCAISSFTPVSTVISLPLPTSAVTSTPLINSAVAPAPISTVPPLIPIVSVHSIKTETREVTKTPTAIVSVTSVPETIAPKAVSAVTSAPTATNAATTVTSAPFTAASTASPASAASTASPASAASTPSAASAESPASAESTASTEFPPGCLEAAQSIAATILSLTRDTTQRPSAAAATEVISAAIAVSDVVSEGTERSAGLLTCETCGHRSITYKAEEFQDHLDICHLDVVPLRRLVTLFEAMRVVKHDVDSVVLRKGLGWGGTPQEANRVKVMTSIRGSTSLKDL